MMRCKIPLVLAFILGCTHFYAANRTIQFKQISVSEGLSQSTVYDMKQDFSGYLWVATADGLNKYDGYEFTVYRNMRGDSCSINSNAVNALLVDSIGQLWAGTSIGLSRFNPVTNNFKNYSFRDINIQVYDIVELNSRQLIIASDTGIFFLDKAKDVLELKFPLTGIKRKSLCLYKGGVLVGTSRGIYFYSITQDTTSLVIPQLANQDISDIVYVEGEGFWIATFGNGLYKTDYDFNITDHYLQDKSKNHGLASDYIRVLEQDDQKRLWVGTFEGLYIYDPAVGRFDSFMHSFDDENSLSQNSIRSIFIDNQKGVWLGTYYGGLCYYHPLAFRFGNIRHHNGRNSLSDNTVSCIVEEGQTGNLWIGTNDGGLNYYDASAARFIPYKIGSSHGSYPDNIKCILQDGTDYIYVGTHAGGLVYMNTHTGKTENYNIDTPVRAYNSCYSLLDIGDGALWVGTLHGLYRFDKRTKHFSPHACTELIPKLQTLDIHYLYKDSKERVWICTNRGLYCYLLNEGRIIDFELMGTDKGQIISNASIVSAQEDTTGNLWFGTNEGLFQYVEGTNQFINYTTQDGLPNNYIYGILEDSFGCLWLSTNKGLSCFKLSDKTFRNYSLTDGIHNEQFNQYGYCKSSSGMFYFGGINGITYFRPAELIDNPYSPKPVITGITIFNEEVVSDERVSITKDVIGHNIEVKFPSSLNVFSLKYVVINPIASGNNLFAYTLEGFDNHWYETRNREVSYSNLSPGRYVFKLKACNNDGLWSEEITSFVVNITPMWYETWIAKCIYVLLALVVLFIFVRYYLERAEKKRVEEMSQEKIRFYVNLSHELRTPLSLILSPLDDLRAYRFDDKYVASRFALVRRNAVKLLHMVNQLLEYRKAESGILRIQVAMENVETIVSEVFSMFEENAHNRDMDYCLDMKTDSAVYPVDRNFIERILMNLLSNAFKFTLDGGMIQVMLYQENDRLVLKVKDNGKGIPDEDKNRIFDRFYKVDESRPGTGIGLSIVKRLVELHHGTIEISGEVEKGTEFTITLPTQIGVYHKDELSEAEHPNNSNMQKSDPTYYLEDSQVVFQNNLEAIGEDEAKQETLLLVEDNVEITNYLFETFRHQFHIVTATNGQEALEQIKKSHPDIIITDLMMPVMDGLKLVQSVKQNIQTSHIPIIVLTAKDSQDDQIRGLETGADDYLTKPFSTSVLQAKIANQLKAKYRLLNYYSNTLKIEPEKVTRNNMDGEFLKKAIKIVEENISNADFSVDDFCKSMYMSRSNLHLKMKAITGESTINFIRKIRMNHACKLLREGTYSIAEISDMTGFNTPSYFTTTFKKHVGCLPTEYTAKNCVAFNKS